MICCVVGDRDGCVRTARQPQRCVDCQDKHCWSVREGGRERGGGGGGEGERGEREREGGRGREREGGRGRVGWGRGE